jgi:hypothetical protein
MDGSAIDSFLPIFSVLVTTLRAIVQCGELQTLVPAMPEECASPMCTLLFSCMLFLLSLVRFFFKSSLFLLVSLFLVAFFLLLMLPLIKKDTRGHPVLGSRRFPNLYLASQDARCFSVDLFDCYLSSRIN